MTFSSGVLDQYHVSAYTRKNFLHAGIVRGINTKESARYIAPCNRSFRQPHIGQFRLCSHGMIFWPVWKSARYNVHIDRGNRTIPDQSWSIRRGTVHTVLDRVCSIFVFVWQWEPCLKSERMITRFCFENGPIRWTGCSHGNWAFQKAILYGTYLYRNLSLPGHNRIKNRAGSFGSSMNKQSKKLSHTEHTFFWNRSFPCHNRPKNRARSFGSSVNRRSIRHIFGAL